LTQTAEKSASSDGVKPTTLSFSYAEAKVAAWIGNSGMLVRDLGLLAASDSTIDAKHWKAKDGAASLLVANTRGDFYFLYLLRGGARFEQMDGTVVALNAGDSLFVRPFPTGTLHVDADFEAFDFVGQGLLAQVETDFSARAEDHGTVQRVIVSRDIPANYIVGNGPRRFFTYRDLGVATGTDRRIHIHCIRLAHPVEQGTGWHIHSMDQFFFQASGQQHLYVEGAVSPMCRYGDVMAIPAGTRHNVDEISDNYCAVEICIPADYDTLSKAAPDTVMADH
jgi:mannose-6-phosphate isomerase-like protein (cupin superfamily)/uncharacterized cupin superfamily protein